MTFPALRMGAGGREDTYDKREIPKFVLSPSFPPLHWFAVRKSEKACRKLAEGVSKWKWKESDGMHQKDKGNQTLDN